MTSKEVRRPQCGRHDGMSSTPRDPSAVPDGIHDTGDLDRIWDALEQLAAQVDARASDDPGGPPTPADGAPAA